MGKLIRIPIWRKCFSVSAARRLPRAIASSASRCWARRCPVIPRGRSRIGACSDRRAANSPKRATRPRVLSRSRRPRRVALLMAELERGLSRNDVGLGAREWVVACVACRARSGLDRRGARLRSLAAGVAKRQARCLRVACSGYRNYAGGAADRTGNYADCCG